MLEQIWRRLQLLFAQGRPTLVDHDRIQVMILDEETLDNVARPQPYGLSYRPHPGGEAYLAFPSGDRSFGIALLIGDRRYRMLLAPGEVALHDDQGQHVHIQRDGTVEVSANTRVHAVAPLVECSGDLHVRGNVVVDGHIQAAQGYYGQGGGVAQIHGGAYVLGEFRVNGKDVSDAHTHTTVAIGAATTGVN